MTTLASLSIAARLTLNMHSLNNEGGEGNQIQTRMVDIVGADGRLHNVNAISGDMLRHVLAEHLQRIAGESGLPLCGGCRRLDANRVNAEEAASKQIQGLSDRDGLDYLLGRCAIDDTMGVLITAGNRSLPRKSVVEFGWVLGMPARVTSDAYFHVKYASERGQAQRTQDAAATEGGANTGQAIFHRPASSGVYAVVCHLELARIGYNDIAQRYALDADAQKQRMSALLQAVAYTFLELNGAMRAAQLPHLVAIQGVISTSAGATPAPLVSPLAGGADDGDQYRIQIEALAQTLNPDGSVAPPVRFDTVQQFAGEILRLAREAVPHRFPSFGV